MDLAGQSLDLISLEPETHLANEYGLQICFHTFSITSSDRLFENLVQSGHARYSQVQWSVSGMFPVLF